jgi:NADP-dependent 3-hydroxy acid dehydrogenase YdfG
MADKVLLITGASSGIGAATARHAANAGYAVSPPERVDVNEILIRPIAQSA